MIQNCRDCRDAPYKNGRCKVHYKFRFERTKRFLLDLLQQKVAEVDPTRSNHGK